MLNSLLLKNIGEKKKKTRRNTNIFFFFCFLKFSFINIRYQNVLGLGLNKDWIRLNVDCLGVVLIDEVICVAIELLLTVVNDVLSNDISRSIVA